VSQSQPEKIGLFGGSFDPVHLGHLAIAEAAHTSCGLDRVIFIPCWQSPHKSRKMADGEHRAAMLERALADAKWGEVSRWELERDSPSYSWMTAEHMAAEFPGSELHWILGTDQWEVLETWAKPERLAELLTFIVFPRGSEVADKDGFDHVEIDVRHPASSTEIRSRVADGRDTNDLLEPEVASYIDEHDLYRGSE